MRKYCLGLVDMHWSTHVSPWQLHKIAAMKWTTISQEFQIFFYRDSKLYAVNQASERKDHATEKVTFKKKTLKGFLPDPFPSAVFTWCCVNLFVIPATLLNFKWSICALCLQIESASRQQITRRSTIFPVNCHMPRLMALIILATLINIGKFREYSITLETTF